MKTTWITLPLLLLTLHGSAQLSGLGNKAKATKHKAAYTSVAGAENTSESLAGNGSQLANDPSKAETEDYLKGLCEEDGFYSAALLQNKAMAFYKPPYDDRELCSVVVVGLTPEIQEENHNTVNIINIAMTPQLYTDARTLQWTMDELGGTGLQKTVVQPGGMTQDDFTIVKHKNGLLGFRKVSTDEYRFIFVPFKKDMLLKPWKESFQAAATGLDESNIACDVFVKTRQAGMAVNLESAKTELLKLLKDRAKAISGGWEAQDQKEIDEARFPAAGMNDPALEKELLAVVQKSGAAMDFDPAQIKKFIIEDSDWSIRKNDLGIILGKTIGVTVGFSKDGHCYYASFQIQKDYEGGGNYQKSMHYNDFHSRWTELRCENLK